MESITFADLQAAEVARSKHFKNKRGELVCPNSVRDQPLIFWSNAMAGEAGEAANVAKKFARGDFEPTEAGFIEMRNKLGSEIADAVIYGAIMAEWLGLDLGTIVKAKFNEISEKQNLPECKLYPGVANVLVR